MAIFSRFVRYFEEVARRGSVRSAAEFLNVAPSAVDRQILMGEEELDAALFERLPKGMKLTPAGDLLVNNVRRWQKEYERVKIEMENLQGFQGGRIRIATTESMAGPLLAQQLAAYNRRYPRVSMTVQVALTNVPDMVAAGEADIGLTFSPTANRPLRIQRQLELPLGLVVPPGHPFAARSAVHFSECAQFPLIAPDESLLLRGKIDMSAAKAGANLRPTVAVNNFAIMISLVASGLGVGFLTRLEVLQEVRAGRLLFVRLADKGLPTSTMSLVTSMEPPPAATKLAASLAEMIDLME